MDLYDIYDGVEELLQPLLLRRLQNAKRPDYRLIKALAATYELQEWLANELPELPEGEEPWEKPE